MALLRWEQFKPMSPYLSALSLSHSLPCQATTLWGHKMGLREWGDDDCGENYGIWQKRGEKDVMDWKKWSLVGYYSLPFISVPPPLCPLKTSMREQEQKADFAIFFPLLLLPSRLRRIHNWQAITTKADWFLGLVFSSLKFGSSSSQVPNLT